MSDDAGTFPTLDDFLAQLDSEFSASSDDGRKFDLLLTEVNTLIRDERQTNFSLLFRAPLDTIPAQGTYRLSHPGMPEMQIFLVPVKSDGEGVYFEAVFNNFAAQS